MTNGAEEPFQVVFPQYILQNLKAWGQKAIALGIRQQFAAALRTVLAKMTVEPLRWGDPNFRLHNMGLLVCHRVYQMLDVTYAVDEQRRIVYVKEMKPLPGHPLGQVP